MVAFEISVINDWNPFTQRNISTANDAVCHVLLCAVLCVECVLYHHSAQIIITIIILTSVSAYTEWKK